MKAMLLAAGRGQRMRPLTDTVPKPLLEVGGRSLLVHNVERLVQAGFTELVINHAWLGQRIVEALGDGSLWGARIVYSPEPAGALEVGGGIRHALPLLGDGPFVTLTADVWTDYAFERLRAVTPELAHLVLADNPPHCPQGDFSLRADGTVADEGSDRLTFTGIAAYHPDFFAHEPAGRFALAPMLRRAMRHGQVSGERHPGTWMDIGTPERLAALDASLAGGAR